MTNFERLTKEKNRLADLMVRDMGTFFSVCGKVYYDYGEAFAEAMRRLDEEAEE